MRKTIKAIVPVAGAGERLRPFTSTVPKPLLPVAGKPILAHIIDNLIDNGVGEFVLIIGYMGDKIREFARRRYPTVPINFVEQTELLGLGWAVKLGLELCGDEPIVIALGDTIIDVNLKKIIHNGKNIIGIHRVENPSKYGIVELEKDRIISLVEKPEKPRSDLAMTGFYYINETRALRSALENLIIKGIKTRGEYQLTDALQAMNESGSEFFAVKIDGWFDCGTVETLLVTNRHLLKLSPEPEPRENAIFIPPVSIGEGAIIERSVIGPFVSVGEQAIVRDTIISDSILGDGAVVEMCNLKGSILGNGSTFRGVANRMIMGDHSEGGICEG